MRIKHCDWRNLGEERVISAYNFRPYFITEEIQGRNLEIGTDAEDMEGHCSLAWSSWFAQHPFWNHPESAIQGGTIHSRLGPTITTINEENIPQACCQANLMELFSQLNFPLSEWFWLVWSRKNTSCHHTRPWPIFKSHFVYLMNFLCLLIYKIVTLFNMPHVFFFFFHFLFCFVSLFALWLYVLLFLTFSLFI